MLQRFLTYVLLFIVLSWSLLLAISIVAVHSSYEFVWWTGLLALAFPVLLFGEFVLLVFCLFVKWPFALIPLLFILGSWQNIKHYVAFSPNKAALQNKGETLKISSYNVNVFDLYNWTNNRATKDSMLGLIKREDPDILCLQEFYTENAFSNFNTYKVLQEHYKYNYFHKGIELAGGKHWGLATFSKYPIIANRTIGTTDNRLNLCLVSDIDVNGKSISVYNTHLHSYHVKEADLTRLNRNNEIDQNLGAIQNLLYKAKLAYTKRLQQVKAIKNDLNQNKLQSIICGDFNDTPNSFPYRHIKSGMKDPFLEKGFGLGGTYRGGTITGRLPKVRIDFILCDTSFEVKSIDVLRYPYSDHYPLISTLVLPE
ncbi:MAG: endonuclease/exonuclease/phosphatase family protein [Chitinophagales bacterium]